MITRQGSQMMANDLRMAIKQGDQGEVVVLTKVAEKVFCVALIEAIDGMGFSKEQQVVD
jgi:hypothetical protein